METEAIDQAAINGAIREYLINIKPVKVSREPADYADMGQALKGIRDQRLYRGTHNNFYIYCAARFGMKPERVDWLIARADNPVPAQPAKTILTPNPKSLVYFIESMGKIKIGVTTNLVKRFANLRNMSPTPLKLIGHVAGDRELEMQLHYRLAKFRTHGEWFTDTSEVRQVISEIINDPNVA